MAGHKAAFVRALDDADQATHKLRRNILMGADTQVAKAVEVRAHLQAALDAIAEVQ